MLTDGTGTTRGMHYIFFFALFTVLVFAVRGFAAIRWSEGMQKSVRANIGLVLVHKLIFPPIALALMWMGQKLLGETSLPHISPEAWAGVPVIVTALAYLLAYDFMDYWNHRLLHSRGFWDIHAVHHSETDMNWTTSYRIHLLEPIIMRASYLPIVIFLGLPPLAAVISFVMYNFYNAFVHTDLDIHFGPFSRILATPRFHRWHHAHAPEAYGTNFANIFSFWDVLFGTYRVPGRYTGPLGFEGTPGHEFTKLLLWPYLRWIEKMPNVRAHADGASSVEPVVNAG